MKYRNKPRFIRRTKVSNSHCQPKSQVGQGMTEYIIIVALIALASIAAVKFFGGSVQGAFGGMAAVLGGDAPTAGVNAAKAEAGKAVAEATKERSLGTYYTGQ